MPLHDLYVHDLIPSKKYSYDDDEDNLQAAFKFASYDAFKKAKLKHKMLFINRWFLIVLGKILSFLYALGCALTIAAAAVAFLCGLTGLMWPGILGGIFMFISGFVFNIKITWKSTPKVLLDFFGRGKLFKGLTEYIDRYGKRIKLNSPRKRWLAFGIFCAIASAAMWAAIGWESILGALGLLLTVSTTAIPPVLLVITAIILTGLFISNVAILIKEMSLMLGKSDIIGRLKTFANKVKDIFSGKYFQDLKDKCQDQHPDNPQKAYRNALLKDIRSVFVGFIVVGLTVAGLTMMLKTGMASLSELLAPVMHEVAATVISVVNCFFFALSGELPFALGTSTFAANSINQWLQKKKQANDAKQSQQPEQDKPKTFSDKIKHFAKTLWRPLHIGNALGNGFIAMKTFMGNLVSKCPDTVGSCSTCTAPPDIGMMSFSLMTGFINSFAAGFHGDDDEQNAQGPYRHLKLVADPKPSTRDKQRQFRLRFSFNNHTAANEERRHLLAGDGSEQHPSTLKHDASRGKRPR